MARRFTLLILIVAGFEVVVGLLLGFTVYQVRDAMRRTALAAFQTNLTVNKIAARAALGRSPTGEAELAQPKTTTLLFVGDVMLARGVALYTEREGSGDFRFPFAYVSSTLRAADLTVGNLEHPVSDRGKNQGSQYSLRATPAAVDGLVDAGFDVVSLANNHIWDWGTDALSDTLASLDQAGIAHAGAGMNEPSANAPVTIEHHTNRIAFVSWTNLYPEGLEATGENPGVSRFREDEAPVRVRELANSHDIVVVLLHFGDEYRTNANEAQKRIARALVDAGADLVIGHHPHVVEEVERYEGSLPAGRQGWIAYSLGNFVFDQGFSEETMRGLALRVTVKDGRVEKVEELHTQMNAHFQPAFVDY